MTVGAVGPRSPTRGLAGCTTAPSPGPQSTRRASFACSFPRRWVPAEVELPPHGWAPPTGAVPEGLPFGLFRAGPAGCLPVYRDIRHGRTKVYTIVRKIRGDDQVRSSAGGGRSAAWTTPAPSSRRPAVTPPSRDSAPQVLAQELHKVCGGAKVTSRPGRLEVHGDFKHDVVAFLTGLGL